MSVIASVSKREGSQLCILNHTGDTKIIFDKNNKDEVENAERTFKDLRKKGYVAYSVKKGGDKGEVITEFDKDLKKIILAPPVVGG